MIFEKILKKYKQGEKQFVVLIDPEKASRSHLQNLLSQVAKEKVDMIFLGGSTLSGSAEATLSIIREFSGKDVLLFPGNVSQITPGVDAVLFLTLISGRNPNYLIDYHVKAAPLLKRSEVIPVGYILIDGGRQSATASVSQTEPMCVTDFEKIVNTAIAGELLGQKMIYLEAGSGAKNPVPEIVISKVKAAINVPLIVGGGIKDALGVSQAYAAGADIVVVGNALECANHSLSSILSI